MQNNVNTKSWRRKISVFGHFSRISEDRAKRGKYASFEGVELARNSRWHTLWGEKKRPTGTFILAFSGARMWLFTQKMDRKKVS